MENSIIGPTPPLISFFVFFIRIKIKKVFFKYDNCFGCHIAPCQSVNFFTLAEYSHPSCLTSLCGFQLYLWLIAVNASRRCTEEGVWERLTDYNACMAGAREQVRHLSASAHPEMFYLDRVQPSGHE